jgi:hypothetical protein
MLFESCSRLGGPFGSLSFASRCSIIQAATIKESLVLLVVLPAAADRFMDRMLRAIPYTSSCGRVFFTKQYDADHDGYLLVVLVAVEGFALRFWVGCLCNQQHLVVQQRDKTKLDRQEQLVKSCKKQQSPLLQFFFISREKHGELVKSCKKQQSPLLQFSTVGLIMQETAVPATISSPFISREKHGLGPLANNRMVYVRCTRTMSWVVSLLLQQQEING